MDDGLVRTIPANMMTGQPVLILIVVDDGLVLNFKSYKNMKDFKS